MALYHDGDEESTVRPVFGDAAAQLGVAETRCGLGPGRRDAGPTMALIL